MKGAPGQDPGQEIASAGFSWEDYVDELIRHHGTLAAVAARLAELRAFADDVGSVERALRRLRQRGQRPGGVWGERALAAFGLPGAAAERVRWMGLYHSRFCDMAVPLCQDLVRLWDRPPVNEAPAAATWLALAHASNALRSADVPAASLHLRRARATLPAASVEATIEHLLVSAFVASHPPDPSVDPYDGADLVEVGPLLERPMPDADRACFRARWIDQRAYELNRSSGARDYAAAEALYLSLPEEGAPPFVLFRRANGLAFARHKQGDPSRAVAYAREAVTHAGDGGHLRLRAMALGMLARVLPAGAEADAARARARAIVGSLDDEALRLRLHRRIAST